MIIRLKPFIYGGLLILLIALTVSCQSTPPLAEPSMPGISVCISDDLCPDVTVDAGQQVVWTNQGSREHIVRHKPVQGDSQFSSGTLQPGDSFSFIFLEPGIFVYECSPDDSMAGTVTVQ